MSPHRLAANAVISKTMLAKQNTTLNPIDSTARAIEVVQSAAENLIILDLDETLFLRNSTEAYLDAIHPRVLGAVCLFGIKLIGPWRWLPTRLQDPKLSKDWMLVVFATLLFPWTPLVWRFKAKRLAKLYWNRPLVDAIDCNPNAQVIVATLGFDWIVNPLLKHLPQGMLTKVKSPAIACRFWQGASDRAKGKLQMVTEEIGEIALSQAVVVTDSLTDAPLLAVVKTPCLVVWPEAKYVPAMAEFLEAIAAIRTKVKALR